MINTMTIKNIRSFLSTQLQRLSTMLLGDEQELNPWQRKGPIQSVDDLDS